MEVVKRHHGVVDFIDILVGDFGFVVSYSSGMGLLC
jgi:hypothetical protein